MGYKTEFNWLLKLHSDQGIDKNTIKVGEEYMFEKDEHRVYPINIPIDLVNENWEVVAKVVVKEFSVLNDKTQGVWVALKLYNDEESKFLTKYWGETLDFLGKIMQEGQKVTKPTMDAAKGKQLIQEALKSFGD